MRLLFEIFLNAGLILLGVQLNPIYTFFLVHLLLAPKFRRLNKTYAAEIDKAFKMDVNLDYYSYSTSKWERGQKN